MSDYDDNPLTWAQQYDEDCRLGLGHLNAGKPAGVRTRCKRCVDKETKTKHTIVLRLEEMLSSNWRCHSDGHGPSGETMITVPYCFCPEFKAGDLVRVTIEKVSP